MKLSAQTYGRRYLLSLALLAVVIMLLAGLNWLSASGVLASKLEFDRRKLPQLLPGLNYDNDLLQDILGINWQTLSADNEYDQFVGASITPKTVSDRIYDALVFFQSNRIALMVGGS